VYHNFRWVLVATFLTAKLHSLFVEELELVSESEILNRSGMLPPTLQPWFGLIKLENYTVHKPRVEFIFL